MDFADPEGGSADYGSIGFNSNPVKPKPRLEIMDFGLPGAA